MKVPDHLTVTMVTKQMISNQLYVFKDASIAGTEQNFMLLGLGPSHEILEGAGAQSGDTGGGGLAHRCGYQNHFYPMGNSGLGVKLICLKHSQLK